MDRLVLDGGPFPQAPPAGPYFDPELRSNISVITSGAATLNCRVYNIGNRTVCFLLSVVYVASLEILKCRF